MVCCAFYYLWDDWYLWGVNRLKTGRIEIPTIIGTVPALLLFYAPFHEGDYGFYVALRLIVCVVSIFRIYKIYEESSDNYSTFIVILFLFAVILFQPFWSWGIERETWAWIDVFCGLLFLGYSIKCIYFDFSGEASLPPQVSSFVSEVKDELKAKVISYNSVFIGIKPLIIKRAQEKSYEMIAECRAHKTSPRQWVWLHMRSYCIIRFKSGECHWPGGEISSYGEKVFELFDYAEDRLLALKYGGYTPSFVDQDKELYRSLVCENNWEKGKSESKLAKQEGK